MNLTYDDVKLICDNTDSFKMKYQKFGDTEVAQCTYFLASTSDFFPDIVEVQEDGKKITLYGELVFNGKKLKDMDDSEIASIGFEELCKFSFNHR